MLELHLDLEGAPDAVEGRPPYSLGPGFSFDLEVLHHLVWSNSIDARDPDRPVWPWREAALRLGATPSTVADVTLPDGRPAWVDGGPVRFFDVADGHPVVHRVSVEHGALIPFGSNQAPPELAADQASAVTHHSGGSRVIAPAGSGKTRVLTERARLLRQGWQIPADALTLVAFNKRAQEEMRERTVDVPRLHVRTLNSLALAIVNGEAPFASTGPRRTTIDEGQVRQIIDGLVQFPKRRNVDPVAAWIEALTAVRLGLATPEAVERSYGGDVDGFADDVPALPRRAGPARRTRLRRADLRRPRAAPHRTPGRATGPRRRAGCCSSTSSRTSRRHTCCCCGCSPPPRPRCSASATTTRRSTATTAPTRRG